MNEILTIKEVAELLKVKPVTVYKLINQKKLPAVKISGSWRFKREVIEQWIEKNMNENLKTTEYTQKKEYKHTQKSIIISN